MTSRLAAAVVVSLFAVVPVAFAGCAGSDDPTGDGEDHGTQSIVDKVYTVDGWMSLEDDYVPRVCTQENGAAATEALKAQAVAARTYVLRAMRDDPTLGTTSHPIENGQGFQTYAAQANAGCVAASSATRGQVGQYEGALIIANYVAGAYWSNGGPTSDDPTATEHWVTYNNGLSGSAVHPTALSYLSRSDNRGCMSQNGSNALAQAGQQYGAILRYFYGADLEIATLDGSDGAQPATTDDGNSNTNSDPTTDTETSNTGSSTSPWSSSSTSTWDTWPTTTTTTTSSTTWW
jgi:hypothetical protein